MMSSLLVIVDNLHIRRAGRTVRPLEAYSPLVVDADAPLPLPIAVQPLEPVAGERQVPQARGRLQLVQLPVSRPGEAGKGRHPAPVREGPGAGVPVADDHHAMVPPGTGYV